MNRERFNQKFNHLQQEQRDRMWTNHLDEQAQMQAIYEAARAASSAVGFGAAGGGYNPEPSPSPTPTYDHTVEMIFTSIAAETILPSPITSPQAWTDWFAPGVSGPAEVANVVITGDTTITLYCNGVLDVEPPSTGLFTGSGIQNFTDSGFFEITGVQWFDSCLSLDTVRLQGASVVSEGTFNGCVSLSNFEAPALAQIDYRAFYNCDSLTYMNVGFDALINVGNSAFESCDGLAEVNFPNCVNVSDGAFRNCVNLIGISLPSVTSLGSTLGDNGVFEFIAGNTITATFNLVVQYDADINYLGANNTLNVTWV